MREILNYILLVEGKSDAAYISSLIKCEIVTINGLEIDPLEIDYINHHHKTTIVFTDSDKEGKKIRAILDKKLINKIDVEINIDVCDKNGKHGVAEAKKDELIGILSKYCCGTPTKPLKTVRLNDIESLCVNKEQIVDDYHLGRCNTKKLIERLNSKNISAEELIKRYGNQ